MLITIESRGESKKIFYFLMETAGEFNVSYCRKKEVKMGKFKMRNYRAVNMK